jgi:hypothetical protein
MPITVTHELGRRPTFAELQALAGQHDVGIDGDEQAGDFRHPHSNQPRITGHYTVDTDGNTRGDFTGNVMGRVAGNFALTMGKAEVTITEKPFLLPEAILENALMKALKNFCAEFDRVER